MQPSKTGISAKTVKAPAVKPQKRKFPLDREGLNQQSAARAEAIIGLYLLISGADRRTVVRDIVHDLMHLCDRDLSLESFDKQNRWAVNLYGVLTQEY